MRWRTRRTCQVHLPVRLHLIDHCSCTFWQDVLYLRREDWSIGTKPLAVELFKRRIHVSSTAQALGVEMLSIKQPSGQSFVLVAAGTKGFSIRVFSPNTQETALLVEACTAGATWEG